MALTERPELIYEGAALSGQSHIDVIMPYYNTASFVEAQIESILKQTVQPLRLTILDNGSRPEDARLIKQLVQGRGDIRLFRINENGGVLGAFEFLLGTVTAPYFALSDSDDIWDADKLEVSLRVLERQNFDLVYTDLKMADQHGKEYFPSKWRYSNTPPLSGNCPLQFVLKNPVSGCTIVGHSRMIADATPFPNGIPMHDRWLAIVAALGHGVGFVNRSTMLYRQHGSNDTGGLGFGLAAFKERMRRNGGDMRVYTRRRLEARKVLLRHISSTTTRTVERHAARLMLAYYDMGVFGTVLAALPYALLVAFVGKDLGVRNIAADTVLNIARVFSNFRASA